MCMHFPTDLFWQRRAKAESVIVFKVRNPLIEKYFISGVWRKGLRRKCLQEISVVYLTFIV